MLISEVWFGGSRLCVPSRIRCRLNHIGEASLTRRPITSPLGLAGHTAGHLDSDRRVLQPRSCSEMLLQLWPTRDPAFDAMRKVGCHATPDRAGNSLSVQSAQPHLQHQGWLDLPAMAPRTCLRRCLAENAECRHDTTLEALSTYRPAEPLSPMQFGLSFGLSETGRLNKQQHVRRIRPFEKSLGKPFIGH